MSEKRLTRQELYDRIRSSSKEEYILGEMKRLGFWATDSEKPSVAETLIVRESTLTRELNELAAKKIRYQNAEQMLSEMRKKRLTDSKEKQTKLRNEENKKARADQWKIEQEQDIIYLGKDYSHDLTQKESNAEKLQTAGLPVIHNALELANKMGISVSELRFLAYDREVGKMSHYQHFQVPKKRGGHRNISAPMPRLKAAQYWVLNELLQKLSVHQAAHGFVFEKNIVSNAASHTQKEMVLNIDLKDFFPSITYPRIKGLFKKMGYSPQVATILALICTEPPVSQVEMDNIKYFVREGERQLPQGSPCSPAITNILCRSLDKRFEGLARKFGFSYSRYADDITFSGEKEVAKDTQKLLFLAKGIIKKEGFEVHPDKIELMPKGSQQKVTGIIVNEAMGIERATLRRFRALLHQIEKTGLEGRSWGKSKSVVASVQGYANFVSMVKPEQGKALKEEIKRILELPHVAKDVQKTAAKPTKEIKKEIEPMEPKLPSPQESENEGKDWWDV